MKPLRIDFATPGMARTFFQSGVAAALLVAATLGLCGWTGATAMALLAEQNARSSDARLAEQRVARPRCSHRFPKPRRRR